MCEGHIYTHWGIGGLRGGRLCAANPLPCKGLENPIGTHVNPEGSQQPTATMYHRCSGGAPVFRRNTELLSSLQHRVPREPWPQYPFGILNLCPVVAQESKGIPVPGSPLGNLYVCPVRRSDPQDSKGILNSGAETLGFCTCTFVQLVEPRVPAYHARSSRAFCPGKTSETAPFGG